MLKDMNIRNIEAGYPAVKREELSVIGSIMTQFDSTTNDVLIEGKKDRA
jgi:hypothetical protein